jgi:hypothetical protein
MELMTIFPSPAMAALAHTPLLQIPEAHPALDVQDIPAPVCCTQLVPLTE